MSTATTAPVIVCPDWCGVAREDHLEELKVDLEGTLHHRSAPGAWATISHVRYTDGQPYGVVPPSILLSDVDVSTPDEAQNAARDLLAVDALLRRL